MELTTDWKGFQDLFLQKRKALSMEGPNPIFAVTQSGGTVLCAYCDGEEWGHWVGLPLEGLRAEAMHREVRAIPYEKLDEWLAQVTIPHSDGESVANLTTEGAARFPHFFSQLEFLRAEVLKQGSGKSRSLVSTLGTEHFLLDAIQTSWARLFPGSYGVLVRVEKSAESYRDLVVVVRNGKLSSFFEPDIQGLSASRRTQRSEVVRYLSERYVVPVQGIFVTESEWSEWSALPNPWGQITSAVRADRTKLMPFKWGLVSLMAARGYLGL